MQIAKNTFLKQLDTMKKILDLVGFKLDKRTKDYQFAKSEIMNYTYENLRKLFKHMEDEKLIEKCECNANLRQGFKKCKDCGGSGYRNKKDK